MLNEPGVLQIEDIVVSVNSKWVKNNTMKIYEIETYKGVTVSTTYEEVAEQAYNLKNQPAILTVSVVQKPNPKGGHFTNRYLQSIVAHTPAGAAMAKANAAFTERVPEDQPDWKRTSAASAPQNTATADFKAAMTTQESATQTSIHRQVAAKVAGNIASGQGGTAEDFWNNVQAIFRFFETGVMPFETKVDETAKTETRFIPESAIRSELDRAPAPTDDGIPF